MSEERSTLGVVSGGAVLFFVGKVASNVSNFLLQILLTRTLGAASYGVYSYAQTILSVVGVFARLGVTESIMRFVPEFEDKKTTQGGYITIAFSTSIIGAIVVSVLLFSFAGQINELTLENPLFTDVLRILALFLPLQVSIQAISNTFRAFEDARNQIFIRDVLVPVLNVVSVAIALMLGATIVGASAAVAFAGLLAVAISLSLLIKRIDIHVNFDIGREELYEYYNFSIPLTLTAAGSLLYTNVDRLMIGYFLGEVEVGIYGVAIGLATVTGLALSGLNQLFPPIASKLHSRDEREELQKVFKTVTRWSFTLCLLPAVLLYTFRLEVLALFGSEFTRGSVVLSLFVAGQIIRSAVGPSGYMLMMSKHQYVVLFNRWFLGVSNVIANYILITRYGFVGAAVASALTLSLVNLFRILELWILERYNPYTRRYLKPVLAGVIVVVLMRPIRTALLGYGIPEILLIMFGGISGTLGFVAIIYFLGIDQVDYEMYRELRGIEEE
ncbi:oligosaccharide flippase family protein [Halorubrum sp. CBA1125]|uniref:flippase n=1 Tax=Halorubrum sp. CBA1125 TaxID=2668072 RepID=UPI0012E7C6D3|nr:flippase [Halorubrum sp. CBA1125]MUW13215.1 oligosaccharide flippase family protein [Halorubrum sp. CBA1125]